MHLRQVLITTPPYHQDHTVNTNNQQLIFPSYNTNSTPQYFAQPKAAKSVAKGTGVMACGNARNQRPRSNPHQKITQFEHAPVNSLDYLILEAEDALNSRQLNSSSFHSSAMVMRRQLNNNTDTSTMTLRLSHQSDQTSLSSSLSRAGPGMQMCNECPADNAISKAYFCAEALRYTSMGYFLKRPGLPGPRAPPQFQSLVCIPYFASISESTRY